MEETKTHWKKLTNPDYLGAYSLDEGKDLILTIKEVRREMVTGADGKKEECTVAHFVQKAKPMILNVTNCKAITKAYDTPYIEEWAGVSVRIYVAKVKAFGETVEALRIKPQKQVIKLPELTPDHTKWKSVAQAIKDETATMADVKKKFEVSLTNENLLCSEYDAAQTDK